MSTSTSSRADGPVGTTAPARVGDGVVALVLGLAATAWAAVRLQVPSLWADEGATLSAVQRSWPELWRLLGNIDAVHGLHYALLKLWFTIVPVNAVTLRLPSLLAVGVLVGLTHLLTRRWFDRRWAVLAAVVVALLPRTTWMAIEGRSWALGSLLVLEATLLLVGWRRDRSSRGALIGYAALMAPAIAMNVYVAFLVVAHGLTLLLLGTGRRRLLRWVVAAAAAGVLASPVVVAATHERAQLGDRSRLGVVGFVRDVVVKQFTLGDTPGTSVVWVPGPVWTAAAIALAVGCWGLVALALVGPWVGRGRGAEDDPGWRRRVGEPLLWAIPWVVVPPVAVLVGSLVTGGNLYHPRYFGFAVPAFAIAVVAGVHRFPATRPWSRLRVALVVVLAVLTVPVWASQRDVTSKGGYDWSRAAAVVQGGTRTGDGVWFGVDPASRVVGAAYPRVFSALDDFGRLETPAQEGSLDGESAPLGANLLRSAPNRVWGIWSRRDDRQPADLAVFQASGYRSTSRWAGPETVVVLLER